jgi:hypothetical protein
VSLLVSAPATRKTVLVLGHTASGLLVPTAGENDEAIMVLVIGWPVTEPQRAVLDRAEDAARTARITFDARLLASADEIPPLVETHDRLLLDANPRETRRIRRALARRS